MKQMGAVGVVAMMGFWIDLDGLSIVSYRMIEVVLVEERPPAIRVKFRIIRVFQNGLSAGSDGLVALKFFAIALGVGKSRPGAERL